MRCNRCGQEVNTIHATDRAQSINDWACDGCRLDQLEAQLSTSQAESESLKEQKEFCEKIMRTLQHQIEDCGKAYENLRGELGIANQIINSQGIEIRDQADKLRRIAGLDENTNYFDESQIGVLSGFNKAHEIASGLTGPDFRGMCERAESLINQSRERYGCLGFPIDCPCGCPVFDRCHLLAMNKWLKDYKEVKNA